MVGSLEFLIALFGGVDRIITFLTVLECLYTIELELMVCENSRRSAGHNCCDSLARELP